MDNNFVDFDAFLEEEAEADAKEIKIGGVKYTLPAQLPAKVALLSVKLSQSKDEKAAAQSTIDMFEIMVGKDAAEQILSGGISFQNLAKLIKVIFAMYKGEGDPLDAVREGNAKKETTGK